MISVGLRWFGTTPGPLTLPGDTVGQVSHGTVSDPGLSDYKNRNIQLVPDGVDGVAEDQILETAVSVGSHDDQIGMHFAGVVYDFLSRIGAMPDGDFDLDFHLAQRFDEAVEIFAAGFHFGR